MNLNALRLAIHKAKLSNIQLQQLSAYRTLLSAGTGEKKRSRLLYCRFYWLFSRMSAGLFRRYLHTRLYYRRLYFRRFNAIDCSCRLALFSIDQRQTSANTLVFLFLLQYYKIYLIIP